MRSRSRAKRIPNSGRSASALPLFSSVGVTNRTTTRSTGAGAGASSNRFAGASSGLSRSPSKTRATGVERRVELFHRPEFRARPAGSQALSRQFGEGLHEIGQRRIADIEKVNVKVKVLAGRDGVAVQVSGAEDEWTRPIGQAAGAFSARGARLKDARVSAGGARFARLRFGAARRADELPEDCSERSAHHVAGLIGREVQRARGTEVEPEAEELERQRARIARAARLIHFSGRRLSADGTYWRRRTPITGWARNWRGAYRLRVKVLCSQKGLGLGFAPVLGVEPSRAPKCWLGRRDSNPDKQLQRLPSYR